MKAEGRKRLASMLLMVSSVEAMRRTYNSQQGVDEQEEAAIKQTMLPDWDRSKSLLFVRDEKTDDLAYINMSCPLSSVIWVSFYSRIVASKEHQS